MKVYIIFSNDQPKYAVIGNYELAEKKRDILREEYRQSRPYANNIELDRVYFHIHEVDGE